MWCDVLCMQDLRFTPRAVGKLGGCGTWTPSSRTLPSPASAGLFLSITL